MTDKAAGKLAKAIDRLAKIQEKQLEYSKEVMEKFEEAAGKLAKMLERELN